MQKKKKQNIYQRQIKIELHEINNDFFLKIYFFTNKIYYRVHDINGDDVTPLHLFMH